MRQKIHKIQRQSETTLTENKTRIGSFGNDSEGFETAYSKAVIYDRSHWGLLKLTGDDRLRFLHNQTTNNINKLKPGLACDTVFINSTGRIIDLVTVYVTNDSILILVSPNRRHFLMEWIDRYIFPMDKVKITDVSDQNIVFTLIGSECTSFLKKGGINGLAELLPESHCLTAIGEASMRIAVGSGLAIPGYTLIVPINQAKTVWEQLIQLGIIPIGDRVWEQLRIRQGRPLFDKELTEDYNPLEAGLWRAISFEKGCYIGQETIARLNTYKGVKQRLWGVKLSQEIIPGTPVILDGKKVGILTSCTEINQSFFGLAYISTKAGGVELSIQIEKARGKVIKVPFLTHKYY
ncbi:CAF17-like 4Fe-4S cluster assembly/insertion protein YgfZ [cyanobacterium endosymbiont of Epithemia turgida]|uniref:CAF17-like 4Fe-4S cluster assembly/insertion protein YgfZ n=1 Tax=cyanobacterium endosymbiont of Epithemia turgida TaxID=718217 RepID=UPI0004D1C6C1|nr:folate-binding protein YgfZ [cyanobacterium endosymbiont of Epithemia turgida]BAP16955.1 aminomethyl transferase, glycine cleavage T protein [cyanobacterium endosymbiont of Epithemia turgida isolate EtSB Lake Yunoko]